MTSSIVLLPRLVLHLLEACLCYDMKDGLVLTFYTSESVELTLCESTASAANLMLRGKATGLVTATISVYTLRKHTPLHL